MINKYLEYLKDVRHRHPHTVQQYKACLEGVSKFINLEAAMDYRLIHKAIEDLSKVGIKGQPWCAYTTWRAAEVVKFYYQWLMREKIILVNPFPYHEFEKGRPKPAKHFDKEVDAETIRKIIYNPLNSHRDTAILHLFFSSGFRPMEIANFDIGDADCENRFMKVRESKQGGFRDVPITEESAMFLEIYLNGLLGRPKDQPLFYNRSGRRMKGNGITKLIMRIGQRIGIIFNAYMFRHGVGADLINKGADISVVADILGHKSYSTTKAYLHFRREKLRAHLDKYSQAS